MHAQTVTLTKKTKNGRSGKNQRRREKIEFDIRNNFYWMCLFVYVFARSNRSTEHLEEYEDKWRALYTDMCDISTLTMRKERHHTDTQTNMLISLQGFYKPNKKRKKKSKIKTNALLQHHHYQHHNPRSSICSLYVLCLHISIVSVRRAELVRTKLQKTHISAILC